jgi:hypothetical protein
VEDVGDVDGYVSVVNRGGRGVERKRYVSMRYITKLTKGDNK